MLILLQRTLYKYLSKFQSGNYSLLLFTNKVIILKSNPESIISRMRVHVLPCALACRFSHLGASRIYKRIYSRSIRCSRQKMSFRVDSIPHEVRTATEPRQNRFIPVRLSQVEEVNAGIRLLRLALPDDEVWQSARRLSSFERWWSRITMGGLLVI